MNLDEYSKNIFQDAWNSYLKMCYPMGVVAEQERQLRQAFFSGFYNNFLIFTRMVANLPEMEAMNCISLMNQSLDAEVTKYEGMLQ